MEVEIIFRDKIAGYRVGEVVKKEYDTFVRAVLRGGQAEVVNPPDFDFEVEDRRAEDESRSQYRSDGKQSPEESDYPKRARKKSETSSPETTGDSAEGYGGFGEES